MMSRREALPVARTVEALRAQVAAWRRDGLRVALVPTMGALHEGHLSLVRLGLARADRVVASIFVNPAQFGPHEDFSRYPRQEEEDCLLLQSAGAHLAFVPTPPEMYPDGFATRVHVSGATEVLEGPVRPGHFDGVATVVAKLLLQSLPDVAVFGEKDWQQLCVIRRMVADLDIPVEIVGAPIVRDEAGLALSSRNAYLSPEQLAVARTLNRVLFEAAALLSSPARGAATLDHARMRLLQSGFEMVDYLEAMEADLSGPFVPGRPGRLLVAARIGGVRLIDNTGIPA